MSGIEKGVGESLEEKCFEINQLVPSLLLKDEDIYLHHMRSWDHLVNAIIPHYPTTETNKSFISAESNAKDIKI